MTIRVLLADDNEITRRGLTWIMDSSPDIEVCGEAVDGEEAVARAVDNRRAMPASGQEDPEGWERYLETVHRGQIRELIKGYRPDLLWFDGAWERDERQWRSIGTWWPFPSDAAAGGGVRRQPLGEVDRYDRQQDEDGGDDVDDRGLLGAGHVGEDPDRKGLDTGPGGEGRHDDLVEGQGEGE